MEDLQDRLVLRISENSQRYDVDEHLLYAILIVSGSQGDKFLFYKGTTQLVVNEIDLPAIHLVVEIQLHM